MNDFLQLVVGHVEVLQVRIFNQGQDERPPQRVHVADSHGGEDHFRQGHRRRVQVVRNAGVLKI